MARLFEIDTGGGSLALTAVVWVFVRVVRTFVASVAGERVRNAEPGAASELVVGAIGGAGDASSPVRKQQATAGACADHLGSFVQMAEVLAASVQDPTRTHLTCVN